MAFNQGFINHNYRKDRISLGEFESFAKLMSHTDIATNLILEYECLESSDLLFRSVYFYDTDLPPLPKYTPSATRPLQS
jgi:hypothetical protein